MIVLNLHAERQERFVEGTREDDQCKAYNCLMLGREVIYEEPSAYVFADMHAAKEELEVWAADVLKRLFAKARDDG